MRRAYRRRRLPRAPLELVQDTLRVGGRNITSCIVELHRGVKGDETPVRGSVWIHRPETAPRTHGTAVHPYASAWLYMLSEETTSWKPWLHCTHQLTRARQTMVDWYHDLRTLHPHRLQMPTWRDSLTTWRGLAGLVPGASHTPATSRRKPASPRLDAPPTA